MSERVAVLGGGSFGTVLANIIAANSHPVSLWVRDAQLARQINEERRNPRYLEDYELGAGLHATTSLAEALREASVLIFCVPSGGYRDLAAAAASHVAKDAAVISTAKGLEPNRFKLMSAVLSEELPTGIRLGILSGPNIATELARREITATVLASQDDALIKRVHDLLYCAYLRVYSSSDVYGVELAGVLKNIYAIIGGIAAGMGVGYNSIALLITRSLAEMCRFAVSTGARPETFLGLAGTGDLIVTFLSPQSRNYRFGRALGAGRNPVEAIAEVAQTVEGVNTLRVIHAEARERELYMPLMEGLYKMVHEGVSIESLLDSLMHSEQRADVDIPVLRPE